MMRPRLLAACLAILLVAGAAWAANTPPPGLPGQFITNGGNNQWGVASTTSGTAAAQMRGIPTSVYGGYIAFGDINTYRAQTTVSPWQSYPTLIANHSNLGLTTYFENNFTTYDCDVVNDEIFGGSSAPPYNPNTEINPLVTWLPGVLNPTFGAGAYQNNLADTNRCRLAGLTWLAEPAQYKTLAQTFSTSGTWANDTSYGGAMGITTTQNAASATTTITTFGGPVYLAYKLQAVTTQTASGGTFSYSLGGTITGSATSAGNSAWTYVTTCGAGGGLCPTSKAPAAVRIPSTGTLPAGTYGLSVNVTSASSSNNPVTLLGAWTPPGKAYLSGNPTVFYGGQIFEQNNAQSAAVAAFNAAEMLMANNLFSDGLSVDFVNVQNYINSTTDMASTLNPNSAGQFKLAQAFEGAIQVAPNLTGMVDPRAYGAECNTQYFDNRGIVSGYPLASITSGTPTLTIPGYNFNSAPDPIGDVNKSVVVYPFDGVEAGPLTTILSVSTTSGGSSATLAENMMDTSSAAYVMMGHNDSAAFVKAQAAATQLGIGGNGLFVPPNCGGVGIPMGAGVTWHGQATAISYSYPTQTGANNPEGTVPVFYIYSNNQADDGLYGINVQGGNNFGLDGFEIRGANSFPFERQCMPPGPLNIGGTSCTFGTGPVGSLVGTSAGTTGTIDGLRLSNMNLSYSAVCLGGALGVTSFTGHLFGSSFHSSYINCGVGNYLPNLSDWKSDGDDFSGSYADLYVGGPGYAVGFGPVSFWFVNARAESRGPIVFDGAANGTLNNFEMQFTGNNDGTLILNNVHDINIGSGFIQPDLGAQNRDAVQLCGSNNVSFDGVNWIDARHMLAATITGCTASTNITINGGTWRDIGGVANWVTAAQPTPYNVDINGWPYVHMGESSFGVTTSGQAGFNMAGVNPTAGTGLDLLNDITTNTSSIGLPGGTTVNRPTTPVNGMFRNNSTTNIPEIYERAWSPVFSAIPNFQSGMTLLNDTTTPNSVIDILPGYRSSDDGIVNIFNPYPYTKTTASFVAGAGNGCLLSGTVTGNSWYSMYAMDKTAASPLVQPVDYGCELASNAAPALPANFTEKGQIGVFETDGSAHILSFTQVPKAMGVYTYRKTAGASLDISTTSLGITTTSDTYVLDVPTNIVVTPHLRASIQNTTTTPVSVYFSSIYDANLAPTTTVPFAGGPGYSLQVTTTPGTNSNTYIDSLPTSSTGTIHAIASQAGTAVSVLDDGFDICTGCNYSTAGTPFIDGSSMSSANAATITTTNAVTLTTNGGNEDVTVLSAATVTGAGILSVTTTPSGLTFTNVQAIFTNGNFIEAWHAPAPTSLTNEQILVTYSGPVAASSIYAFSVANQNVASPFDPNGSLPASTAQGFGTHATINTTVSTTKKKTLVFNFMLASRYANNNPTPIVPSGYTALFPILQIPNIAFANVFASVSYQVQSSPLTSSTPSYTLGTNGTSINNMISNAYQGSGQ